jgi:hypothetical protein
MSQARALSRGAALGRMLALATTGLAVVWVVGLTLSIIADGPKMSTLLVIAVQGFVALGMQAYVIWRIAASWGSMSILRRLGLTLVGTLLAPLELALGIVAAAVAAGILVVVAAGRGAGARSSAARLGPTSGGVGQPTGWVPPEPRRNCSMCTGGQQPCPSCGGSGYRHADGAVIGLCYTCGGNRTVTCGNCHGSGFSS